MTGITGKIAPVWLILSCTRLLPKTPKQPYSTPLFYNFLSSSCLKPGGSCQFSSFFDDLNTHTHKAQANSQWFFWKTFYGADILLTHWRPCHPKPAVQEYTALKHCNFLNRVNNALTVSCEHWVEKSALFLRGQLLHLWLPQSQLSWNMLLFYWSIWSTLSKCSGYTSHAVNRTALFKVFTVFRLAQIFSQYLHKLKPGRNLPSKRSIK